jgi:hypothetical protein
MVEEQAISRIHRLGQEKAVFICRFVIANTFEQRILERQTRKRVLQIWYWGGRSSRKVLMKGNNSRYGLPGTRSTGSSANRKIYTSIYSS